MRAAEYYQVPPWELLSRPYAYTRMASYMIEAKAHQAEIAKKSRSPWL